MIDKYLLDDLSRMSDEKGHLARWVIQLQIDLDVERRKAATLSISRDDMKYRAEAAEAALSAANEKLSKPVVLPPRRSASSFVDEEFSNEDLAAIYNAARLEFSVKVKNAGFTVEGNADAE